MFGWTGGLAAEGVGAAAESQPLHHSQVGAILQNSALPLPDADQETKYEHFSAGALSAFRWPRSQSGAVSGWQAAALCDRTPPVRLLSAMTSSSPRRGTAQSQHWLWHPFHAGMVKAVSGLFPSCKRRHQMPSFPHAASKLQALLSHPSGVLQLLFRLFLDMWHFAALLCFP